MRRPYTPPASPFYTNRRGGADGSEGDGDAEGVAAEFDQGTAHLY